MATKQLSGKNSRNLIAEINEGIDQMAVGVKIPVHTVNVTKQTRDKRMAMQVKPSRSKRITTKDFFALSEEFKKTFLFNLHLGFHQAWLDFGLDFPRKYWLTGSFVECVNPNDIHDTYVHNHYTIGAYAHGHRNRYVEYGIVFGQNDFALNLPVQEHMLEYQGNVEAGVELFNSWIKKIGHTTLPAASLKETMEFAILSNNICDIEILHVLAETKCLSRQQFIRTWSEMKRDFKSEQYALRGYHGPEVREQFVKHPTFWSMMETTPKKAQSSFDTLLDRIEWKR